MQTVEVRVKNKNRIAADQSEFLKTQHLVEFALGDCEGFRSQQLEVELKSNEVLQSRLKSIERSLDYLEVLSQAKFSEEELAEVSGQNTFWIQILSAIHWRAWPAPLRWSFQALFTATLTAALVAFVPWKEIPYVNDLLFQKTVELARVERGRPVDGIPSKKPPVVVAENQTGDNVETAEAQTVAKTEPVTASGSQKQSGNLANSKTTKVAGHKTATKVVSAMAPATTTVAASAKPAAAPKPAPMKPVSRLAGFVHRSYGQFVDLENIAPKIVDKIKELGGAKAGKVELGWARKGGRYFHYSMPEKNHQLFLDFLNQFGKISISKDAHRRVMPKGTLRNILWITNKKTSQSGKSE